MINVAVKMNGYNLSTLVEETFYFSDIGFSGYLGDSDEHYYEPLITGGILFNTKAGTSNDSMSIKIINDNKFNLINYLFNGYSIEIFISKNKEHWFQMFSGSIDSVLIQRKQLSVKVINNFDVFQKPLNPSTFTGVNTNFEGDSSLEGVIKPRLFGKVFNITPISLYSSHLIYGCNWDYDGNRDSVTDITSVRDGGGSYTIDGAGGIGGNFTTTALMDAYTVSSGKYVKCVSEGTIKLGSSPTYGLTIDVEQATLTISDMITLLISELSLPGKVIFTIPSYDFGEYLTNSTSYLNVFNERVKNLDLAYWFDASGYFSINSLRDKYLDTVDLRFIDSNVNFKSNIDILAIKIERTSYELPPEKLQLGYKRNYTIQTQNQLVGATTEAEKDAYKSPYLYNTQELSWIQSYKNIQSIENNSNIYDSTDATSEVTAWLDDRDKIKDQFEVTCKLMDENDTIITGVVYDPPVPCWFNVSMSTEEISSTSYLISDSGKPCKTGLILGDTVYLNSDFFENVDKVFIVYGISINTKNNTIKYTLKGKRDY